MAQLRDAKTGELLAEGTPNEIALTARELGRKAVVVGPGEELPADADLIFDDVGFGFDPAAVLQARADNLDGLRSAIADPDTDDDFKDRARERAAGMEATEERIRAEVAPEANAALEEARARADV